MTKNLEKLTKIKPDFGDQHTVQYLYYLIESTMDSSQLTLDAVRQIFDDRSTSLTVQATERSHISQSSVNRKALASYLYETI